MIVKEDSGSKIIPIPAGVHVAVCSGVIDLGMQYKKEFDTKKRELLIMWEIPGERITIEEKDLPRIITNTYTSSLSPKSNLRKTLESWRGKPFSSEELKGFDMKNVLGKACMLQVIHKTVGEKTYANISSIMSIPAGTVSPEPENLLYYDLDDTTTSDVFEKIPEWIQNKIKNSETYKLKFENPEGFTDIGDDESLPFS